MVKIAGKVISGYWDEFILTCSIASQMVKPHQERGCPDLHESQLSDKPHDREGSTS